MDHLVECVPNVSEGRDSGVVDRIGRAATEVEGVALLDTHVDPWHHRSVLTLAGPGEAVSEAAFRLVRAAADAIDLRAHRGEHPRIGAADVVPFVPLDGLPGVGARGGDMALCVRLARALGEQVAGELGLPVYLYGEAASRPGRTTPATFRRGGFERLREEIGHDPALAPDLGPSRLHPRAGAVAIGARKPLVAFNVLLGTGDVEVARRVARKVRTSSGGLPAVQALGFGVDGRAQLSANLLDVETTPPAALLEAVRAAAEEDGVEVEGSQIVGLVPEGCLPPDAGRALRLAGPVEPHLLERRLREAGVI